VLGRKTSSLKFTLNLWPGVTLSAKGKSYFYISLSGFPLS
jgi:hypothetical protein